MTDLVLSAAPLIANLRPKIEALGQRLSQALDAFAEARMRRAVPARVLRQAKRDTDRYRRLLHPENASRTDRKTPTTGSGTGAKASR